MLDIPRTLFLGLMVRLDPYCNACDILRLTNNLLLAENLPGNFAVWAASPEASFLHGRFVWCTWDVNDLASGEVRAKIDSDPWYLKVGVRGL